MDKYAELLDGYNCFNTDLSIDELFEWLKKKIAKGNFESFRNSSDEELITLARLIRPIIKMKLEIANEIAREQLKKIKEKRRS